MTAIDGIHAAKSVAGRRWPALSLAQQFALAGGLVMLGGMLVTGLWVTRQIEQSVVRNAANATALYVDSFISPLASELEDAETLSVGPIRALDEAFRDSPLGKRLISVKIWRRDGTIVYSDKYELIGERFEPSRELLGAYAGNVEAEFDELEGEEAALERRIGLPLLEIYSPIRAAWTGKVIAVAEFYEDGTGLAESIAAARLKSWLVVAAVMATMAALLMGIVYRGSRTISRQRLALNTQLKEVTRTSDQNRVLREKIQQSSERVAELNEQYLRRTSAELHDGPAQLLALASLRIESAAGMQDVEKRSEELTLISKILDDAMKDIRNLCGGLSLPEIDGMTIGEVVERVANAHMERTGTEIDLSSPGETLDASHPVKICVYRFIQEALNNASQHAGGEGQSVVCRYDDNSHVLAVRVSDDGPGFAANTNTSDQSGLGLAGLRERVQSIGGELSVDSKEGGGTVLEMRVGLKERLQS